ncbi:hypothetical protein Q5752_006689 [Cryptotrichosporon argae]
MSTELNEKADLEYGTQNHSHAIQEVDQPTHLSVGDILRGSAHSALTPFERKAALINEEIDKFGFGRYQICIWFLCGFGYFLDLAWAQGVGLVMTAVYQEMNVPAGKEGVVYSCANAGLALGALSFGIISDTFGRRWAFNSSCLITSVFGMLLAAPKFNYGAICGIYFLASFGLGGNIPIDAAIALETLPQNRRMLVSLLSMWQPIGVVAASGLAYGTAAKYRCDTTLPACNAVSAGQACCTVASNMGWRYCVIIIGAVTLLIFAARYLVFRFLESPKFLLGKGKEQEAIDVLHKIAAFNRQAAPTLTVEQFAEIDRVYGDGASHTHAATAKDVIANRLKTLGFLKGLFASKLQTFTFVVLALAYMGDYWSFNLAGSFLPIILLRNNVSSGETTVTSTYREYIYIYLPGIVGAILALFSVQLPLLGRKWSLVLSATLQGLSMAMYTQVKTTAGYVGLNAFEYIMQTFFNAVLYASAPEVFDTTYRASASGMLSCLGRLAGIVAPFAGQKYDDAGSEGILWLGAGGIWLSALVMVFLPIEMRNRQMY